MKIKNLKIGTRLAVGFGFVCLALVFMVVQGMLMLGRVNDGTDEIANQRLPRMEQATRLLSEVNDIGIALRNMMLNDNEADRAKQKQKIEAARKEVDTIMDSL